ncbi:predicted protein [Botrytis cinerea T4]|uniref:Uncharacterized protein n=1 Tax=Botryotinia fuckeliana (strain T4) TaxID=999810 RepID=G2YS40_BOTF4|nr:predicted protein [Botrytis cinerea T4]
MSYCFEDLRCFTVPFPPEYRSRKQLCDNKQPLVSSENPELAILQFKPTETWLQIIFCCSEENYDKITPAIRDKESGWIAWWLPRKGFEEEFLCLYQKWATSKNLLWIDRDRMTKNSGVVLPSKSKLIHNTIGFIIPYFVLMVKPCE